MMILDLAKRALKRRKKRAAVKFSRRAKNQNMAPESLEERTLLAVTPIEFEDPATGLPDGHFRQVEAQYITMDTFQVPAGTHQALVFTAGMNEPGPNNEFWVEVDGVRVDDTGAPLPLSLIEERVNRQRTIDTGVIRNEIYVVPLGNSNMDREVKISFTSGFATDIQGSLSLYEGVDQTNPVDDVNGAVAGPTAAIEGGNTTAGTSFGPTVTTNSITAAAVDPGDAMIDSIYVKEFSALPGTQEVFLTPGTDQDVHHNDLDNSATTNNDFVGAASHMLVDASSETFTWDFTGVPSGGPLGLPQVVQGGVHIAIELEGCGLATNEACTEISFDYGDAPDSFGTTFAANGPRHADKGLRLGTVHDTESDAKVPLDGTGDDGVGLDDEDGIALPVNATFYSDKTLATTYTIDVTVNNANQDLDGGGVLDDAYLNGWIDFDGNGVFDSGEQVISGVVVSNGINSVTVSVPAGVDIGATFARFRVHSGLMGDPASLLPGGHANDGEVEDYPITVNATGRIEGTKYHDIDGDGSGTGASDGTFEGIKIAAYTDAALTMPAMDVNLDVLMTTTDSNGEYSFPYILPGSMLYVAELLDQSDSAPADGILDDLQGMIPVSATSAGPIKVAANTCHTADFVNTITGSIHGFKYFDADYDGTFDTGETPIDNVQFTLYKFLETTTTASGDVFNFWQTLPTIIPALTDGHGEFWFTGLMPGMRYMVVETNDAGYDMTNDSPVLGSHPDGYSSLKMKDSLGAPVAFPAADLLYFDTLVAIQSGQEFVPAVGDHIMEDLNGDDTLNAIYIDGQTIDGSVLDVDGDPLNNGLVTGIDLDGNGIADSEVEIATWLQNLKNPEPVGDELRFGNHKGGQFTIKKFNDLDADGDDGTNSPWTLGDIVFELTDPSGTTTDVTVPSGGTLTLMNKAPGDYTLTEKPTSFDHNGDNIADDLQGLQNSPGEPISYDFTINSDGSSSPTFNFYNYIDGSIHGHKFLDSDGDGTWDPDEPAIAGVVFSIEKFSHINTTASGNTSEVWIDVPNQDSQTTDGHGEFWFTGLMPGMRYRVTETNDNGFDQSNDTLVWTMVNNLESGQEWVAALGDHIMEDHNMNGVIDLNFHTPALGDIDIDGTANTEADFAMQLQTYKTDIAVGDALRFGNYKLSDVKIEKYHDLDADGDAGGDALWDLGNILVDINGTQHTLTNGEATVSLGPGTYTLTEVAATTTDHNGDGIADDLQGLVTDGMSHAITINGDGTMKGPYAFYNHIQGSIHGHKFLDLNGDGLRDAGEEAIKGITFTLYEFISSTSSASGSVSFNWAERDSEETDSHGEFWFTGLAPGARYMVVETDTMADNGMNYDQSNDGPKIGDHPDNAGSNSIVWTGTDPDDGALYYDLGVELQSGQEFVAFAGDHIMEDDDMDGIIENNYLGTTVGDVDGDGTANTEADYAIQKQVYKTDIPVGHVLEFGNYKNGEINVRKFHDLDADGDDGTNNPWTLGDIVFDLTGPSGSTVTVSGGSTTVTGLAPGSYTLTEKPTSFDHNGDDIADDLQGLQNSPGEPTSYSFTVSGDGTVSQGTFNFYNYIDGSIHGHKFLDSDGDGTWDTGEPAIAGVVFSIEKFSHINTTASGNTSEVWIDVPNQDSQTTDGHGEFWFTGLMPGMRYRVTETNDNGFDQSNDTLVWTMANNLESGQEWVAALGDHIMEDHDMNGVIDLNFHTPALGDIDGDGTANTEADFAMQLQTYKTDIAVGDALRFGNYKLSDVKIEKYHDLDADGDAGGDALWDLGNILVDINGTQHTLTNGEATVSLGPGTYTLTEVAATTTDHNGDGIADDLQGLVTDGMSHAITINGDGTMKGPYAFYNHIQGSIHGHKFLDLNGDGLRDAGEEAIKGITFTLYEFISSTSSASGSVSFNWAERDSEETDSHGEFWFTGLAPGARYMVVETDTMADNGMNYDQSNDGPKIGDHPDNAGSNSIVWTGTDPDDGALYYDLGVELQSGQEFVAFAGDHIMEDDDMDGIIENNYLGTTVGDVDGDGTANTEADYAIQKQVYKTDIPVGHVLEFGNYKNGEINVRKFHDLDADGDDGTNNPWTLGDIVFDLTGPSGSTVTVSGGSTTVTGLAPGSYTLTEKPTSFDHNGDDIADDLQGLQNSPGEPTSYSFTVSGDGTVSQGTFNFYNYIDGSIHGHKFLDSDGDGTWDTGEPAIAGVVFSIEKFSHINTTASGNTSEVWIDVPNQDSQTTDGHGEFWFTGLMPGMRYRVTETNDNGFDQSNDTLVWTMANNLESGQEWVAALGDHIMEDHDMNGVIDLNFHTPALGDIDGDGTANTEADFAMQLQTYKTDIAVGDALRFGNYKLSDVKIEKYHDLDADGDAGGDALWDLGNILVDINGTQHTLTNGEATVSLGPGTYTLTEVAATTTDHNGDGIADDLQGLVTDGMSHAITINGDGTMKGPYAFYNHIQGSIHGHKFLDLNGDGLRDAGEEAIKGITFTLYEFISSTPSASGSVDFKWAERDSEETDSHGEFWFTGLAPGARYMVVETDTMADNGMDYDQSNDGPKIGDHPDNAGSNSIVWTGTDPDDGALYYDLGVELQSGQEFVAFAGDHIMEDDDMDGIIENNYLGTTVGDVDGDGTANTEADYAIQKQVYKTDIPVGHVLEFGNYKNGEINVRKFHDLDADGSAGTNPVWATPLPAIQIDLLSGGAVVGTGTTDPATGAITFPSLPPGTYTVEEVISPLQTLQGITPTGATVSGTLTIDGTGTSQSANFYNYVTGSIHGFKFHDLNGNGLQDLPAADGQVVIDFDNLNEDPFGPFESFTENGFTYSSDSGAFAIDNTVGNGPSGLRPQLLALNTSAPVVFERDNGGNFTLDSFDLGPQFDIPGLFTTTQDISILGYQDGAQVYGFTTNVPDNGGFVTIPGSTTLIDRLEIRSVSTGGFADLDSPWIIDNLTFSTHSGDLDEVAMEGIVFDLQKYSHTTTPFSGGDPVEHWIDTNRSETTDSHGNFWFTGLMPGMRYRVVENLGATDTNSNGIGDDIDGMYATTDPLWEMPVGTTLLSGQEFVPADGHHIMWDVNMDGVLEDVNTWDADGDGTPDGISEIDYAILLQAAKTPTNIGEELEFGNAIKGSLHGLKYFDYNGNGLLDQGADGLGGSVSDDGLNGVNFTLEFNDLYDGANVWVPAGSTFSNFGSVPGEFWFTGLPVGEYRINEVISNSDTNNDGVPDSTQGLVPSETTIWQGIVSSGEEHVWREGAAMLAPDALQHEVLTDGGGDGPADDLRDDRLMYGNTVLGSIHGMKFEDINGDGEWQSSEPRMEGIQFMLQEPDGLGGWVQASDGFGNLIPPVQTDADGEYWFTDLYPNTYRIVEQLNLADTNGDGTLDIAQGLNSSTGLTEDVWVGGREEIAWQLGAANLANGLGQPDALKVEVVRDADGNDLYDALLFGNYVSGSIHGMKFEDINANGIWDQTINIVEFPGDKYDYDAEPRLDGIYVHLLDSNGDPAVDADGALVPGVTTDMNGEFWFTNLAPGTYTVTEDLSQSDSSICWEYTNGGVGPDIEMLGTCIAPDGVMDDEQGMMASIGSFEVTVESRQEWVWQDGAANLDDAPGGDDALRVEEFVQTGTEADGTGFNAGLLLGNYVKGSLHGIKWLDDNADGTFDPAHWEMGMEWVKFKLLGFDGAGNPLPVAYESSGPADPSGAMDGEFWFTDVIPGSYSLTERLEMTDTNDLDGDGDPDGDGISDDQQGLTNSTPLGRVFDILSRQEFAWTDGRAMLSAPTLKVEIALPLNAADDSLADIQTDVHSDGAFNDLMFGNYWASSIHGVKLQDTPGCDSSSTDQACFAPNIPLFLMQGGTLVDQTTTDAWGEFSFAGVAPGFYTIEEPGVNSGLNPALLSNPVVIGVTVAQGEAVTAYSGQVSVSTSLPYTETVNGQLAFNNRIAGSIHGVVANPDGTPAPGVAVALAGSATGSATTGADGQFHFDDLAPGTYVVSPAGFASEVIIVTSGEEEMGIPGQAALDPGQYFTPNPDLVFGPYAGDQNAPTVTNVLANNANWNAGYLACMPNSTADGFAIAQGATLGQSNVRQLVVEFNEGIIGSGPSGSLVPFDPTTTTPTPDIRLVGGVQGTVAISSIVWDASTNQATINLASNLATDNYELRVGDWVTDAAGNLLDGDGDGSPGGKLIYPFSVLPGDFNGNGAVTPSDLTALALSWLAQVGDANYNCIADANGSGAVTPSDLTALALNWGQSLPSASPGSHPMAPLSARTVSVPVLDDVEVGLSKDLPDRVDEPVVSQSDDDAMINNRRLGNRRHRVTAERRKAVSEQKADDTSFHDDVFGEGDFWEV